MKSVEKIWKQKHDFFSCSPCAQLRHTANIIFAVCLEPGTRQRSMCCRVPAWTHGE